MSGQRHLIECHCILPIYKDRTPAFYHKFAVYSILNEKTGKVVPKYVNCNNCGVTHLVEEFCKSEIKLGKEDIKSVRDIKEVSLSLPEKLVKILESYNSTIDIYEELEDVIDNNDFPRTTVLKREIIDEKYQLKVLEIISKDRFKILSTSIDDTVLGDNQWVIQLN